MSDVLILNEKIPRDLRAITKDARDKDLPLSTTACVVLAKRYEIDVLLPTGYRASSSDLFKLRVPTNVHRKLRLEAADRGVTIRGIVLNTLSTHYGTAIIEPTRRPRKELAK